MELREIIGLIRDDNAKAKQATIISKIPGVISPNTLRGLLKPYGILYNQSTRKWEIDEKKLSSTDLSTNIFHKYLFGNSKKPVSEIDWGIVKKFTSYEEVEEIILRIQNSNEASYKPDSQVNITNPVLLRKLVVYIVEFLEHPMDGLFVTEEHIEGLAVKRFGHYIIDLIKTVSFCLALKHKIRVPIEVSCEVFLSYKIPSICYPDKKKTLEIRLSPFAEGMLYYVEDGKNFLERTHNAVVVENSYRSIFYVGYYFYFAVMFLLNCKKNNWRHIRRRDMHYKYIAHLHNVGLLENTREYSALNLLFYLAYGVDNLLRPDLVKLFSKDVHQDEAYYLFQMYSFYLKLSLRSRQLINGGGVFFNIKTTKLKKLTGEERWKKPEFIMKASDFTKENVEKWLLSYKNYAIKNGLRSYPLTMYRFLRLLVEMKKFYEAKNSLKVKAEFPITLEEIGVNYYDYFGNKKDQLIDSPLKEVESNNYFENSLMYLVSEWSKEVDGNEKTDVETFKTDIQYADEVVRAIYNYKIPYEKGTIEYFNELQMTTLLMVIADSGVRSIEAINMPFGTLSYLKEQGVNICILGWDKLFNRFGVVPISTQTAEKLKESTRIRKSQFSETIYPMKMQSVSGSKDLSSKYVMQFVTVPTKYGRVGRIDRSVLGKHLEKVCEQARIKLREGDRFHFLRHRVAEYFFFCASYYDFDGKNDYEYKETIVKKLLRHVDKDMTKEYYWGDFIQLLAEKKLVFYRDLEHMSAYQNLDQSDKKNRVTKNEAEKYMESIKQRIHKDMAGALSTPNIDKIIKLFTLPTEYISESALGEIAKNQNFHFILDHLTKVDGHTNPVPPGSAYFGRCLNFSCPKSKEKVTCVSCYDHVIDDNDVPRIIGEIVACNGFIQDSYRKFEDTSRNDHVKSLQSRVVSNLEKLEKDLGYKPLQILNLIEKYIGEKQKERENVE